MTTQPGSHDAWPAWAGRRVLPFLIFVAVPLAIGLALLVTALDRWEETARLREDAHLTAALDGVVASQDGGFRAAEVLRLDLQETRSRHTLYRDFLKWNQRLRTEFFPGLVMLCHQSGRERFATEETPLHPLFRQILAAVPQSGTAFGEAAARLDPAIRQVFGKSCSLAGLQRANGEFLRVRCLDKPGLLFLEFHPQGLALLYFLPDLGPGFLDDFDRRRAAVAGWQAAVGKAVPLLDLWFPPAGRTMEEFRLAWSLAERSSLRQIERNGFRWRFFPDRWGKLTCLVVPATAGGARWFGLPPVVCLLGILVAVWGWRLTGRFDPDGGGGFLSITVQLRVLFLCVTFLPLLSGILLGWLALQDQEDRFEEAAFTEGLQHLNVVEGGFSSQHRQFLARARQVRRVMADPAVDYRKLREWTQWLHDSRLAEFFHVLDQDGRILFTNLDEARAGMKDIFLVLSRLALRDLMPHRLPEKSRNQVSAIDLLAEECVLSEELGWGALVANPGVSTPLTMGRSTAELFWDAYPELATGPATVMVTSNRHWLLGRYLADRLRFQSGKIRIGVVDAFSGDFVEPRPPGEGGALRDLVAICEKSGRAERRRLPLSSGPTWAVAQVESVAGRYGLLALQDAGEGLAPLLTLRLALGLGLVASLLVAWLVGRMLAGLFLVPIQDLSAGIEGVRLGRNEVRIPVRRQDEFGALALTFNRMIGELKELEMARIVQADLLPAVLPSLPGFSLAAVNRTATRLGGDYYDMVPLADGSWLLLVGDVTGHGVPAALAMAMAKAGVTFQMLARKASTTDFLEALNHVFFSELRTMRRFMTMLVGILDPAAHRLDLENSGQNFPVLVPGSGEGARMFDLAGFPLGVRKKLTTSVVTVTFQVGDTLFLFTDGIPEAPFGKEDQIGYERFMEVMERACREEAGAQAILDRVLAEIDGMRTPGPYPDDVTLIVLRRDW
ncbi:MAG: SpoIIE family protein phosphatase [Candidatus Riflebacteria bacterium]|nr:SpoIIE family protein phosphatase [Candidatus Riflebacteria bacterium]